MTLYSKYDRALTLKISALQVAGAAHLQRILGGGGSGRGVGVGAKRVAGENPSGVGAGAVGCSLFSAGDAGNLAGDGSAWGGGVSDVGEHKRARLAAGHLKHVLLVFEGDLDTCDRTVISNKLQSLKRLLMKRHASARVVPQQVSFDTD